MKKQNTKIYALTAITLAAITFSASQAYAESSSEPSQHSGEHKPDGDDKGGPRADKFEKHGREMFEKTDTDKDGFLSKEEMEASHRARMEEMFNKTDSDKDGKLSSEELKKGRESMRDKFRQKYQEGKAHHEGEPTDKPAE